MTELENENIQKLIGRVVQAVSFSPDSTDLESEAPGCEGMRDEVWSQGKIEAWSNINCARYVSGLVRRITFRTLDHEKIKINNMYSFERFCCFQVFDNLTVSVWPLNSHMHHFLKYAMLNHKTNPYLPSVVSLHVVKGAVLAFFDVSPTLLSSLQLMRLKDEKKIEFDLFETVLKSTTDVDFNDIRRLALSRNMLPKDLEKMFEFLWPLVRNREFFFYRDVELFSSAEEERFFLWNPFSKKDRGY